MQPCYTMIVINDQSSKPLDLQTIYLLSVGSDRSPTCQMRVEISGGE